MRYFVIAPQILVATSIIVILGGYLYTYVSITETVAAAVEAQNIDAETTQTEPEQPAQAFFSETGHDVTTRLGHLYTNPTALTPERVIVLRKTIRNSDLLKPGEVLPASDLLDVFQNARSHVTAVAECETVLAADLPSCRYQSHKIASDRTDILMHDNDAHFTLVTTLAFALETEEKIPEAESVQIFTETKRIAPITFFPEEPDAQKTAEIAQIKRAKEICGLVRSGYGNCFVENIDLWRYLTMGISIRNGKRIFGPVGELRAEVTYSYLQPIEYVR